MRLLRWLENSATYFLISAALAAGLAASYGRELEARRKPDRHWWMRRLLIMPLLAIMATAATDAFRMAPSMAAFTTAMLSLGGYDVIGLIERRWKNRLEAAAAAADARRAGDGEAR